MKRSSKKIASLGRGGVVESVNAAKKSTCKKLKDIATILGGPPAKDQCYGRGGWITPFLGNFFFLSGSELLARVTPLFLVPWDSFFQYESPIGWFATSRATNAKQKLPPNVLFFFQGEGGSDQVVKNGLPPPSRYRSVHVSDQGYPRGGVTFRGVLAVARGHSRPLVPLCSFAVES